MGFGFGGGVSHAVLLLFICFSAALFASDAEDLLGKGASIKDGETLVSSGGIFELGFFSPGTSKNRYVGIWYYSNPEKVVVWVANREAPVRDLSGTFALGNDGTLQVIGGGNVIAWSSNTSSASNVDVSAELLDTGNLVLRGGANGTGELIWQSFDHPGDTYLPGMQVGLDLRTNVNTLFTSWKSEDDPSTGRYSMGIDPRRTTQIMVWEEGRPVWRSGPWDGQQFVGSEDGRPQYLYGFKFSNVAAEQKMYFWYTAYNNSKERFRMTVKGTLDDLLWDEEKREWQLIASDPSSNCEEYNHCGDYGVCSNSSTPECNCLRGFNPRFPEEWRKGNWSGGCSRRTQLDCQRNGSDSTQKGGDGFLKFERLKLPDASDWIANVDADGCGDVCFKNCSCQAYAYVSGIGCMIWGAGLVDIQQLASGGKDLYLRLAGSELETKKNVSTAVIIASVAGIVAIIICTFILFKWRKKIKGLFRKGQGELPLIDLKSFDGDKHEDAPELPIFSFQTLVVATSNFSHSNMIGEGGFGPVYQGLLHGRKEIAVKRLSVRSGQGMEEFKTEVTLIAKLQHRNLVRLLGFCIHGEERLLIYEYLANRSLDGFIFGTDSIKRRQLDWKKRYDIIGGIARGLLYLHRDSRLTIIHRDLKASNILLDEEMNPKISDFGMARIFQDDGNPANTKRVVGTYGYMSPEYAMDGLFSVKSDVYSFGVIVLEILSGKKNQGFLHTGSSTNLLGYAWTLWIEDKAMEFVDPLIRDNCSVEEAMKCLQLGLLCVQDRPNERPMMPSVVVMLESDSTFLPQPKQPTFTVERSPSDTDSFSGNPAAGLSTNYVTTTVMIGR